MATATSYLEWKDSQQPALALLDKLGYAVLSPEDALAARAENAVAGVVDANTERSVRKTESHSV